MPRLFICRYRLTDAGSLQVGQSPADPDCQGKRRDGSLHGNQQVAIHLAVPRGDKLSGMRDRIRAMRTGLVDAIKAQGVAQDFSFVVQQRGMFSYTGLTAAQVERMKDEFGIYAVSTGRICLEALNTKNVDYVAKAIAAVTKG